jgi:hypothetical protein
MEGLLPHSKKEGCKGLRIEKRNNELRATERLKETHCGILVRSGTHSKLTLRTATLLGHYGQ